MQRIDWQKQRLSGKKEIVTTILRTKCTPSVIILEIQCRDKWTKDTEQKNRLYKCFQSERQAFTCKFYPRFKNSIFSMQYRLDMR